MMNRDDTVLVAGHTGLAGSAIVRRLEAEGFSDVITDDALDLMDQDEVLDFFMRERPGYVFLGTAWQGGIMANAHRPADLVYANLQMQCNVISSARRSGVFKLLFLASSCIYPEHCPQPMREEYLLSGKLEPISEPYAVSKIAGVEMCRAYNHQYGTRFVSVIPADAYGPGDDFDPETAHFLPSLMSRMHCAVVQHQGSVTIWGTGTPRRECLYVDDLADACIFLMRSYDGPEMINVGSGMDHSIGEIAAIIADVVGFDGQLVLDTSRPDGTPRKLLDTTKINGLGWAPRVGVREGIGRTFAWYRERSPGLVRGGMTG